MEQFPPNSQKATGSGQKPKEFEQVTSSQAKRRKKSLFKQFRGTFFGGDAKTAFHYTVNNVVIPATRDLLLDAVYQTIQSIIMGIGETRRGRPRGMTTQYSNLGHVAYNQYRQSTRGPQRQISQRARETHDFDEIILENRIEAADVLDQMIEIVSKFEVVTVSDLYSLTGLQGTHVDNKWGWTDLRGATVRRVGNEGYLLDLPEPEFLD